MAQVCSSYTYYTYKYYVYYGSSFGIVQAQALLAQSLHMAQVMQTHIIHIMAQA